MSTAARLAADEAALLEIGEEPRQVGGEHALLDLELLKQRAAERTEGRAGLDQLPHPRADLVQAEVGAAREVEEHGLAVEAAGRDVVGGAEAHVVGELAHGPIRSMIAVRCAGVAAGSEWPADERAG